MLYSPEALPDTWVITTKQTNDHRDEVVLVTGAGEGIGRAAAKLFATRGYRVPCLGRHLDNTTNAADQIRKGGGRAIPIVGDISRYVDMEASVAQIKDKWGRLDTVVANAGVNSVWAPLRT